MSRARLHSPGRFALWISIFVLCIAAIRLFYGAAVRLLASARDQTAASVDAGWGSVGLALGCLAVAGVLGVVLHRVERERPQDHYGGAADVTD